jgi:hypothetical protein
MTSLDKQLVELVDDPDFRSIDNQHGRFNLFEAIGAVRSELRHSGFLSFLLSPSRGHGLGSEFLLQFIRLGVERLPGDHRVINSLELLVADLDNAVIFREQDNIDVLIEISAIKLCVVIENKVDSAVSAGQLPRYKVAARHRYPGYRFLFVLLTPDGIEADEDEYIALSYSDIASLVESATARSSGIGRDAQIILTHYVEMLRRHIVEDEKLNELVRQLYERHREAFDFVFEKRPQPDDLLSKIKEALSNNSHLLEDRHSPSMLRFVPKEWSSKKEFNSCPEDRWTHTKRNLIFEVRANRDTDRVMVSLILGPTSPELRTALYEFATARPKLFTGLVKPMGAKTSTIYLRELLSANAAAEMEPHEKHSTVEQKWSEFLSHDLPKLQLELAGFRP